MAPISSSPPRAPPVQYTAPHGTRWEKEKAAAGGAQAFDLPSDPKVIGPWIIGECVGKGASGRVKIAKHRLTGQLAAVKILPLAPLASSRASLATHQAKTEKQRLGVEREITMMKLMKHPNILRIYDVYEGSKELFLVLEYVEGGELFDFLVNKGRLPEPDAMTVFKQIIYGLNYAHTFSIIHRDLKPENILLSSVNPPLIKIADWGMAAFSPPSLHLETSCGSPHYASPEIVNGHKYSGNTTDIWSCGVILYALLTGRLPFDDKNVKVLLSKVKSGVYEMPGWINPLAQDLLSRMLTIDVNQRITIPEILNHPWLKSSPAAKIAASAPTMEDYELAPSPSTLARPISDPSLIDSDLLTSLKIIWGRHADPEAENIKRDLCSPAGQGVHAKAFYYLLRMYREDTLKMKGETECSELSSGLGQGSLTFNLGWELDTSGLGNSFVSRQEERRGGSRASSPTVVPLSRNSLSRNSYSASRDRPMSPTGPRPPLVHGLPEQNKCESRNSLSRQPSMSRKVSQPKSSFALANGGLKTNGGSQLPKRGNTYSHREKSSSSSSSSTTDHVSTVRFPVQRAQSYRPSSRPSRPRSATEVPSQATLPTREKETQRDEGRRIRSHSRRASSRIPSLAVHSRTSMSSSGPDSSSQSVTSPKPSMHAPIPLHPSDPASTISSVDITKVASSKSPQPLLPPLPLHTSPKADNVALQMEMDLLAELVNDLVAKGQEQQQQQAMQASVKERHVYQRQHQPRPYEQQRYHSSTRHRAVSFARENIGADKENMSVRDESWSYVGADECCSPVRGTTVGNVALANIANAAAGNANASLAKGKNVEKDRKSRPPPLELPPLNRKSSTPSALGSPIALSPPANSHIHHTKNGLTSPVVGEFKGWLSNLFGWKHSTPNAGTGILYSPDDVHKTRRDVIRLLASLGVVIDLSEPASDNYGMKPLRFRIDFTSALPPATPTSPSSGFFLSAGSARARSSTLGGLSSLPSPNLILPTPGFSSAMIVTQGKGSSSTFKTIWKKLKELYDDGYGSSGFGYPPFSPVLTSTPMMEHPQRFAA